MNLSNIVSKYIYLIGLISSFLLIIIYILCFYYSLYEIQKVLKDSHPGYPRTVDLEFKKKVDFLIFDNLFKFSWSEKRYFILLQEAIKKFEDSHLYISNENKNNIPRISEPVLYQNSSFLYVAVPSFEYSFNYYKNLIEKYFDIVGKGSKASTLIIDLRGNQGGNSLITIVYL